MKAFYMFAEAYLVPLQLVVVMIAMGATLSVRDFAQVFKQPSGLFLGLGLQLVLAPALAVTMVKALDLSPGWALGLLLLAAVPGGAASNLFTYLARGNVPLSVAVTLTTTLICMVTIPLQLAFLAGSMLPGEIPVPTARIIIDILRYLLGPLIGGMLLFRYTPRAAPVISRWFVRLSITLLVTVGVAATGSGRMKIDEYGWKPPVIIALFGFLLAFITPHLCRLLKRYDDDTAALTVEVSVRNGSIALLLVPFFFVGQPEQGELLYSVLFYAGISGVLIVPTLILQRTGRAPAFLLSRNVRPPQ